ncbi:MAG: hypothetical protein QNJ17_03910 [Desulfocapsaceae bacterium]|nr:hypothetical protein [Desulfocapsaceae bacterium]
MKNIIYEYCFSFPSGDNRNFVLEIDNTTLLLLSPSGSSAPAWSRLSYNQCDCCPLSSAEVLNCPIAVNLADLVTEFKQTASYDSCLVSCRSMERLVTKETVVQDGLSSIMGLIMATSGCPIMNILKPMARFHLPFATIDESLFRSVSVYLLRQYFIYLDQGQSDFHLENVKSYYDKIEKVNSGILRRIKSATRLDADRNAIVILNCLAQILHLELDDNLQSLAYIFKETPL